MLLARFSAIASLVALGSVSLVACGGGTVNVGSSSTDQGLKKKTDGSPTGNGSTCSFDDVVWYDAQTGETGTIPSANGEYKVGDTFKSPDGCNDCSCTAQGITCTERACSAPPGGKACTDEAKQCPDGKTYVGRTGPNCEFAACPGEGEACPAIARICKDGSTATPAPGCKQVCPEDSNVACTDDAMLCPDGKTYVSRQGPNCEFAPCP